MANYDKELTFALGQLLKKARNDRHLNMRQVEALSDELGYGIKRPMLSRYELGQSRIPETPLKELCNIYDIDVDALLEEAYTNAGLAFAIECEIEDQEKVKSNISTTLMFARLSDQQRQIIVSIMKEMLDEK